MIPFRRDKADHYLLLRKMRYWLKTGGEESTVDDMQVIELMLDLMLNLEVLIHSQGPSSG